jgi:hypothetical protein
MDVDHWNGGEFVEGASRGQSRGEGMEPAGQGDWQAIGEEGDENMRLNAAFVLMEDRADR